MRKKFRNSIREAAKSIKKTGVVLAAAVMLSLVLGACQSAENDEAGQAAQSTAAVESGTDAEESGTPEQSSVQTGTDGQAEGQTEAATENQVQETESGSNILIVYFTAAENSGVEAVSSASYTTIDGEAVGRVRAVADMIEQKTGGDLFAIQTSVVYPADGEALIDYAAEEQDEEARPELTSHIENLDQYDTIFIGYPTWWYDMPMALYSFFDEYDFSGKTIIPFNVHNGSRFSDTISTIEELEPDAQVVEEGFTVSENDVADAAADVSAWLGELGY